MDSLSSAMFALTAAFMALGIAALYALVWQVLRERWAALLAVGFAFGCAGSLVNYRLSALSFDEAARFIAPLVAGGYLCFTHAIMEYTGFASGRRRFWVGLTVLYLAIVLFLVESRWVGFGGLMVLQAVFPVSWAVLFLRAQRREPGDGHGFNALALLAFPAIAYAIHRGWLPPEYRRNMGMLTHSLMGMTMLTTGLLKTHRTARAELKARTAAQAQLDEVNQSLERRVHERTEALEHMVHNLDGFSRHVAHDLRGPLGGMAGVAQLATAHLKAGRASEVERLLQAIAQQAEVSRHLVSTLLEWARSDHAAISPEPLDMQALVQEVVAGLRTTQEGLGGRREAVPIVFLSHLPPAHGDVTLIRQVWANLLSNALKFSRGAAHPLVQVGWRGQADQAAYFVQDNGVGFSAEQGRMLFQLFQRPHGSRYEGFGIGLCLVKRIVERHGGRVWAESEPGQGARFLFTLTAGPALASGDGPPGASAPQRSEPQAIP
jgi:signal transduction histidine kinase